MAVEFQSFLNVAQVGGGFALPKLDYAYDALEPFIDAQTMEIHHSKHHQAYITKLNSALSTKPEWNQLAIEEVLIKLEQVPSEIRGIVRNHGGGHANHALFWTVLCPASKSGAPTGELAKAIDTNLGGYEKFTEQFVTCATGVFGSGWAWLSVKPNGELAIEGTFNQDSPLSMGHTPILGVDVWEHAYYLKYQNKRPEYLANILKVINWDVVSQRYSEAIRG